MSRKCPDIPADWLEYLGGEFAKDYMKKLKRFLTDRITQGKTIYPHGSEIFTAFNLTPFENVNVVILGQDPYHGPGQAHGLCFSVRKGVAPPPSLINIYREVCDDVGIGYPHHGNLEGWARQGVLLLNSVLTVERNRAASHQNCGWEIFTDKVVEVLNEKRRNIVFLLWGGYAQRKGLAIDEKKHKVFRSPHPSPLSAHRGFFGQRQFSGTNKYLESMGKHPIDWTLPE